MGKEGVRQEKYRRGGNVAALFRVRGFQDRRLKPAAAKPLPQLRVEGEQK
jgi:hypothetical protein